MSSGLQHSIGKCVDHEGLPTERCFSRYFMQLDILFGHCGIGHICLSQESSLARLPCDSSRDTANLSKLTNSSAPSQWPS